MATAAAAASDEVSDECGTRGDGIVEDGTLETFDLGKGSSRRRRRSSRSSRSRAVVTVQDE